MWVGIRLVFAADGFDGKQVGYQAASLWLLMLICPVGRPYVRGAGAWLLGALPSNPP
jgi:hypothetical protein